jgi:hypothetical protein
MTDAAAQAAQDRVRRRARFDSDYVPEEMDGDIATVLSDAHPGVWWRGSATVM